MPDIEEFITLLNNTTAEAVLMGYQIRAPQSHRRGAADLVKLGLFDAQGKETELGTQVKDELIRGRKALSEQDLPLEKFFDGQSPVV